jgi:hypothetical protein
LPYDIIVSDQSRCNKKNLKHKMAIEIEICRKYKLVIFFIILLY